MSKQRVYILDICAYVREVELEEEVDTDEKCPYILQSEVEKAIKELRNKKATGNDDVRVKLNVGLLWQKLHSTRRRLFLLAHLTKNCGRN